MKWFAPGHLAEYEVVDVAHTLSFQAHVCFLTCGSSLLTQSPMRVSTEVCFGFYSIKHGVHMQRQLKSPSPMVDFSSWFIFKVIKTIQKSRQEISKINFAVVFEP